MNVFHTHSRIVEDYKTYICSFLNIADPHIRKIVEEELGRGKLWPLQWIYLAPIFFCWNKLTPLSVNFNDLLHK